MRFIGVTPTYPNCNGKYHAGVTETALDKRLLDAGRRAFRRFGYRGATMERIAEEAGLSRVTLHRRRISKELILRTLAERASEAYRAAMWPALTGPGTALERMELALGALCESAEENLELLVALRAQADAVFHEEADQEALTRSVFTEPLERLLRDGAADGSLRPVDPVEASTVLFNLVGWTYVHLRTGHRWRPERARQATIDIALNGLAPGEAR
jgi:AcrR family transcriptional regulator